MFNKMNVLHWHISDSDSFPLQLKSYNISQYASFSKKEVYSKEDIAEIVDFANKR